jgi:pyruvate formate lyase activating enzyme
MFDTSAEARKKGIRNLVVTGGYINPEPLEKLMDVVDAIKVDLKSFSQDFYVQYVRGDLKPILEAIQLISKRRVWMEIVYLVIPSLNDSPEEIRRMCRWLLAEVGPDVPLHFSRFQPMYLLKNLPPTPVSTLENLWEMAHEEGLHYVYVGNVFGHPKESTDCANCRKEVIRRFGYKIEKNELKGGKCGFCGHPIPGIWT